MRTLNRATLVGRAGQDAETKQVGENSVTRVSIATSRSWKKGDEWQEETQWHNVQAWGNLAQVAGRIRKGDIVLVEGEIRYRKYTDAYGVERSITEISASNIGVVQKSEPSAAYTEAQAAAPAPQSFQSTAQSENAADDLPF